MDLFTKTCRTFARFMTCFAVLAVLAMAVGCGKKAKEESGSLRTEDEARPASELEAQLARQTVDCDNGISCPESLAKVVIIDRGQLKSCTGFLVNSVTLATSSSCLTERMRITSRNSLCQSDIHVYFARSDFRAPKRVGCSSFLLVSQLEGSDPVLWRNDLTYIELSEPVYRRPFRINRDGIRDGDTLTMWKVDRENDQVSVIRKSECKGVLNSYANPFNTGRYDPGYMVSGCALKPGNKGAAILDDDGKWVGVYSGTLDSALMTHLSSSNLLIERLKSLGHVANTVCLPAVVDNNPVVREECFRDLNSTQLIQARAAMLTNPAHHEKARLMIEEKFNKQRPFLDFEAELVADAGPQGSFKVKFKPKCFRPSSSWIRTFREIPRRYSYTVTVADWRLSIGLDSATHIVTRLDDDNVKTVKVEFSPTEARAGRASMIKVSSGNSSSTYDSITACQ